MPQVIQEDEIKEQLDAYERQLRKEWDLPATASSHFKRPAELAFTRTERDKVTILFGGLTRTHDYVLKAAVQGIGSLAASVLFGLLWSQLGAPVAFSVGAVLALAATAVLLTLPRPRETE